MSTLAQRQLAKLRPFYFRTHPDFFVQHPDKRRANEAALQAVNSHLDRLQRSDPTGRVVPGSRFTPSPEISLYLRADPREAGQTQQQDHPAVRTSLVLPAQPCWDLSIRSILAAVGLAEPPRPDTTADTPRDDGSGGRAVSLQSWISEHVTESDGANLREALRIHNEAAVVNRNRADGITKRFGMLGVELPPHAEWPATAVFKLLDALEAELVRVCSDMNEGVPEHVPTTSSSSNAGEGHAQTLHLTTHCDGSDGSTQSGSSHAATDVSSDSATELRAYPYVVRLVDWPFSRIAVEGEVELSVNDTSLEWGRMLRLRRANDHVFEQITEQRNSLLGVLHGATITSVRLGPLDLARHLSWLQRGFEPQPVLHDHKHPLLRHVIVHATKPEEMETFSRSKLVRQETSSVIPRAPDLCLMIDPTALVLEVLESGTVVCPVHVRVSQIAAFLSTHAADAQRAHRAYIERGEQCDAFMDAVANMTGGSVSRSPLLGPSECEYFASGLTTSSASVRNALQGVHIHCSRLPQGIFIKDASKGCIEIPWVGPFM